MGAPPIGPLNDRQRRLETARRLVKDCETPLRNYFRELLKIPPHQITPELFADFQATADELDESIRRGMQAVYDLIDVVNREKPPEDFPESVSQTSRRRFVT